MAGNVQFCDATELTTRQSVPAGSGWPTHSYVFPAKRSSQPRRLDPQSHSRGSSLSAFVPSAQLSGPASSATIRLTPGAAAVLEALHIRNE